MKFLSQRQIRHLRTVSIVSATVQNSKNTEISKYLTYKDNTDDIFMMYSVICDNSGALRSKYQRN